jgi:hypothetical protein
VREEEEEEDVMMTFPHTCARHFFLLTHNKSFNLRATPLMPASNEHLIDATVRVCVCVSSFGSSISMTFTYHKHTAFF